MDYRVELLDSEPFIPLFELDDAALASRSMKRYRVDTKPGYPCRVSLVDAEIGEQVLLLPFEHLPLASPYRSGGAIFIRHQARSPQLGVNELPEHLGFRTLSVRSYDGQGMMVAARVTPGAELDRCVGDLLANPEADFLQIHNADRGCFHCTVRPVPS